MPLVDYLILTPLDEEFEALRRVWPVKPVEIPEPYGTFYKCRHVHPPSGKEALVVIASMRDMGQAWAAAFATHALRTWEPVNTILIGIAGALVTKDLALGDVVIPGKVIGYEVGEALETEDEGIKYLFRPTHDQPSFSLFDSASALYSNSDDYKKWREAALKASSRDLKLLKLDERLPNLHINNNEQLASGNFVVKSVNFLEQLRTSVGNVKLRTVEMEAKGLFAAFRPLEGSQAVNGLVIRGVSDYADKSKAIADDLSKGGYRSAAVRSAAIFASHLIHRRLRLNAPTTAVAASPRLNLKPANNPLPVSREHGIYLEKTGLQFLSFDNFLACPNGSTGLTITAVPQYGNSKTYVTRELTISLQLRDLQSRCIPAPSHESEKWKWNIERSTTPFHVSVAVASNPPLVGLAFSVVDEFNRKAENKWAISG